MMLIYLIIVHLSKLKIKIFWQVQPFHHAANTIQSHYQIGEEYIQILGLHVVK